MGIIHPNKNQERFSSTDRIIDSGNFYYKTYNSKTRVITTYNNNINQYSRINLDDDYSTIVSNLNNLIKVNPPVDNNEETDPERDPSKKGYFKVKINENGEETGISFVLPTDDNIINVDFYRSLSELNYNIITPPVSYYLGIKPRKYYKYSTPEINLSLSTNNNLSKLKYMENATIKYLDSLEYSDIYTKLQKAVDIKNINSSILEDNVEFETIKSKWYISYMKYIQTLLIVLIIIGLYFYVTKTYNINYIFIMVIIIYVIYAIL